MTIVERTHTDGTILSGTMLNEDYQQIQDFNFGHFHHFNAFGSPLTEANFAWQNTVGSIRTSGHNMYILASGNTTVNGVLSTAYPFFSGLRAVDTVSGFVFETRFYSVPSGNTNFRFGLSNKAMGAADEGQTVLMREGVAAGSFKFATSLNGTYTYTGLSNATIGNLGTWHKMKIIGSSQQARLYWDDTLIATNTTNFPSGDPLHPFLILSSLGTNGGSLIIDYWRFQERYIK